MFPAPARTEPQRAHSDSAQSIRGEVRAIPHRNKDSGWAILKVFDAASRRDITITGVTLDAQVGCTVEASGGWQVNPKFGRQFVAEKIAAVVPEDASGMEKYLSSGAIDGIGKVMAKRLVTAFGSDTLRIILNSPARVAKVKGIGAKRAARLHEVLKGRGDEVTVKAKLRDFLGSEMAERVYTKFREKSGHIVEKDPYQLIGLVPGFGFKRADDVALKNKVAPNSQERLGAAAKFVLHEGLMNGNTSLELQQVARSVAKLTRRPEREILLERLELVLKDAVVHERFNGKSYLGLKPAVETERALAERIAALCRAKFPDWIETANIDKLILTAEQRRGMRLDVVQRRAVRLALTNRISVITGPPGSGKSTILAVLGEVLARAGRKAVAAAPTGRGARRMKETSGLDGVTMHVLLDYQPFKKAFGYNEKRPLPADVIVLDEISMADQDLALAAVRAMGKGAQVVFVGDADQLPSVSAGNVLADLIHSGCVPVIRLTEIYRQGAGSQILVNARAINRGEVPSLNNVSPEFRFIEAEDPETARAEALDQLMRALPDAGYGERGDVQLLVPLNKGEVGVDAMNELVASKTPGRTGEPLLAYGREFRVGDKIIQTKNNYLLQVYNGDIGYVSQISHQDQTLVVHYGGRAVEYKDYALSQLKLGFAISVHRSQGSEVPVVVVCLENYNRILLSRQLLFTAVTRAKQRVVLIGPRKLIADAVRRSSAGSRCTHLHHRIKDLLRS